MNGAEALAKTLLAGEVDVCFANPGTSEMHFVAALDSHPRIRCVLGLFEGVATGAADGYARMTRRPAATLTHLGPGLANGLANLHNAAKARSPMVNICGDHASFHVIHESPLRSDIEGVAKTMSHWVRYARRPDEVSALTAAAIATARALPGRIATLLLPADAAWETAPDALAAIPASPSAPPCDPAQLTLAADALRSGEPTVIWASRELMIEPHLTQLGRLAARTGCQLMAQLSTARMSRGGGRPPVARVPYPPAPARAALAAYRNVILFGASPPVSFFGYPGEASELHAPGARLIDLGRDTDVVSGLAWLVDALGADTVAPASVPSSRPELPGPGRLTARGVNQVVARLMPENAILVDESVTSADGMLDFSAGGPAHDMLRGTGGAIGIGIPLAAGAAVACPDRKVIGLQADGSAMYTIQGLWTQARERADVITVLFANRRYAILQGELKAVGAAAPGVNARRMLELDDPSADFVSIARGMGVEAARADTVEGFSDLFRAALSRRGPFLIEAVI